MTTETTQAYRLQQYPKHIELVLLPALNDRQWESVDELGDQIVGTIEKSASPNLLADLSELEYMGSGLVALLARIWKAVQAKGRKMAVVCPDEMVKEVLKIAGLLKIWTVVDDRDAAYSHLGISARQIPKQAAAGTDRGAGGAATPDSVTSLPLVATVVAVLAALTSAVGLAFILKPRPDVLNQSGSLILCCVAAMVAVVFSLLVVLRPSRVIEKSLAGLAAAGAIACLVIGLLSA